MKLTLGQVERLFAALTALDGRTIINEKGQQELVEVYEYPIKGTRLTIATNARALRPLVEGLGSEDQGVRNSINAKLKAGEISMEEAKAEYEAGLVANRKLEVEVALKTLTVEQLNADANKLPSRHLESLLPIVVES